MIYERLNATVIRLLSTYGQDISIKRDVGKSINPLTGDVTAGTTSTLTSKGVLTRFPDKLIDGTKIKKSDRLLVLDSTNAVLLTDRFVVDSEEWSAVDIETIKPADTALAYRVQVRR